MRGWVTADAAPIRNKIFVLILQHPQEQDRDLGTAALALSHFALGKLAVGLSWSNLGKVLGRPTDPRRWGVLYLGSAIVPPGREVTLLDRHGKPEADQQAASAGLDGIVLLDGTWSLGQDAVVAQPLAPQAPPYRADARHAVALRQAAQGAKTRERLDAGSRRPRDQPAGRPGGCRAADAGELRRATAPVSRPNCCRTPTPTLPRFTGEGGLKPSPARAGEGRVGVLRLGSVMHTPAHTVR